MNINPIADIHPASPELTHLSEESLIGRDKGLSKDAPVKQAKTGLWTEIEITELRRLVNNNINHAGTVSWVKVVGAWKLIANLPERSKASLSSKWYDIKSKPAISTVDDTNQTQGSADTDPDNTLTGLT